MKEKQWTVAAVDPSAADPGKLSTRVRELESELSRLRQERTALVRKAWMDGARIAAGYGDNVFHLTGNTGGQADRHIETFLRERAGLPDPPEGGT